MTGGIVVVLGKFGRNFAAGMSGGIAYIYDPDGLLPQTCNKELVDLEDVAFEDIPELRQLIENHKNYTGSSLATNILNNWDDSIDKFVKVFPRDYKRVLEERKKKQEASV
jgi:glutamate synthase domain-containing protein 3